MRRFSRPQNPGPAWCGYRPGRIHPWTGPPPAAGPGVCPQPTWEL